MPRESRYVLLVDNISSDTRTRDIEYEFQIAGKIRDIEKDSKYRCALIEFENAGDAKYAWKKLDGFKMDGRRWKVEYARPEDFKLFGWKWYEDRTPSPKRRSPSRSPSPVKKSTRDDRSRSRSRSPEAKRGRSKSPKATTPEEKHGHRVDASPARKNGNAKDSSPSRSPSPRRD